MDRLKNTDTCSAHIMALYYSRKLKEPFDTVISRLTETLRNQGFAIVTTVDIKKTMKRKLKINFRRYKILGACNPEIAYRAISLESHTGVTLPCNIVVQEHENAEVEVSAINPMYVLDTFADNVLLANIANEISSRMRMAVDGLHCGADDHKHIDALPTEEDRPSTSFSMQG